MTDAADEQYRRPAQRLTPDRVRSMQFARTPIGRRGLAEDEVTAFMQRVADDIATRDASEASLRAKVTHYKNTLVQWQREHSEARADESMVPNSSAATVEAVNILSRAQQEADAYVAQTQEYCRRLAADAHDHAQAVLSDATARADAAAEQAVIELRANAGEDHSVELEDLERRLTWARTFLASLENVETQLRTAREALSYEFEKLGETTVRQ
jgi:DivIVA domain-containing protein